LNGISFEKVRDEHVKRICEIYNYYIKNTTVTYHYYEHNEEQMNQILYSKDNRFNSFVIIDDNTEEIMGYCMISKFKNREAFDRCGEVVLYLDSRYLNRGIGKLVLDFLEDEARKQNFHTLIASISSENERSIRLFESKGYFKCAHFKEVGFKFDRVLDLFYYEKFLE
jgi:L-amino acid N-acyltransferase YncA